MLATLRPLCPRCMPRQRTRGRRCARAPRNARRAGAMPPRYLRRQQWISGAAAEDAAAVAVAPATASGWAATRLAQPLRMASAWADAICPAVNRAGGRLASLHETRACKKRIVQGDREAPGADFLRPARAGHPLGRHEIALSVARSELRSDPALSAYVSAVVQRIAQQAPGHDGTYTFNVVDAEERTPSPARRPRLRVARACPVRAACSSSSSVDAPGLCVSASSTRAAVLALDACAAVCARSWILLRTRARQQPLDRLPRSFPNHVADHSDQTLPSRHRPSLPRPSA